MYRWKAAIVAIDEGVTVMEELFAGTDFSIRLGKRTIALQIESIKAEEVKVSQSIVPIVYQLYDWLHGRIINRSSTPFPTQINR